MFIGTSMVHPLMCQYIDGSSINVFVGTSMIHPLISVLCVDCFFQGLAQARAPENQFKENIKHMMAQLSVNRRVTNEI